MKNLSLVISLALVALTLGACTKQTTVAKQSDSLQVQQNQLTTDQQDTGAINGVGGEQNQGTEKTKMAGGDSTHTTHFHGSPNQNEVDSIKKAKTDKKFNK